MHSKCDTRKRYLQRLVTLQVLVGNSAHCKTYFRKANHTFLFGAEEIYGSSFQRRELFAHLFSRPCKGRLKTTQRLTL